MQSKRLRSPDSPFTLNSWNSDPSVEMGVLLIRTKPDLLTCPAELPLIYPDNLLQYCIIANFTLMLDPVPPNAAQVRMSTETYLNHPTFGLLYRVCLIEENRELFATLYAQRLFFLVTTGSAGIQFEPSGRTDARILVESRLRDLRRSGQYQEYNKLQAIHKQTFQ